MNNVPAVKEPKKTALQLVAERLNIDAEELKRVLKATAFKAERSVTDEEFMGLMVVCNTYGLNPILKEIYAFPAKGGGIVPIVAVDGWIKLVNNHPDNDGSELIENFDKSGVFESVTAKFHVKGKAHPIIVTEYLKECARETEPWKKWPRRMLRHKAFIQGARIAYGFSGIYDEDEAQRIIEATELPKKAQIEMPRPKSVAQEAPETKAPWPTEGESGQNGASIGEKAPSPSETPKTEEKTPFPAGYMRVNAAKDGRCKGCGNLIPKDAEYAFSSKNGSFHADCVIG